MISVSQPPPLIDERCSAPLPPRNSPGQRIGQKGTLMRDYRGCNSLARYIVTALLVSLAVFAASPLAAQNGPPPPQVIVAAPVAKRIAQWDEYTGRFEALQRVE